MLYLLQDNKTKYALVSDTGAADGWYFNICDIDPTLPFTYGTPSNKPHCTMIKAFEQFGHIVIITFSHISEFHNLPQTHPELFL